MNRDPIHLDQCEHEALRLLDALQTTAVRVQQALKAAWPDLSHAQTMAMLARMETLQLVTRNDKNQWRTTSFGHAVAADLGPSGAVVVAGQGEGPSAHELLARATPSRPRSGMGTGDLRAPPMRPGADEAMKLPSLINGHRRWPDGRREAA